MTILYASSHFSNNSVEKRHQVVVDYKNKNFAIILCDYFYNQRTFGVVFCIITPNLVLVNCYQRSLYIEPDLLESSCCGCLVNIDIRIYVFTTGTTKHWSVERSQTESFGSYKGRGRLKHSRKS